MKFKIGDELYWLEKSGDDDISLYRVHVQDYEKKRISGEDQEMWAVEVDQVLTTKSFRMPQGERVWVNLKSRQFSKNINAVLQKFGKKKIVKMTFEKGD